MPKAKANSAVTGRRPILLCSAAFRLSSKDRMPAGKAAVRSDEDSRDHQAWNQPRKEHRNSKRQTRPVQHRLGHLDIGGGGPTRAPPWLPGKYRLKRKTLAPVTLRTPTSTVIAPVSRPGTIDDTTPSAANTSPTSVIADDRLNVPSGVSPNEMIWIAITVNNRPSWPSGEKAINPRFTGKSNSPRSVSNTPSRSSIATESGERLR